MSYSLLVDHHGVADPPAGKLGQCLPILSVEELDSLCVATGAYGGFVEISGGVKVSEHGRMGCFYGGWLAREGF